MAGKKGTRHKWPKTKHYGGKAYSFKGTATTKSKAEKMKKSKGHYGRVSHSKKPRMAPSGRSKGRWGVYGRGKPVKGKVLEAY